MLVIDQLGAAYGKSEVLHGVKLQVRKGEIHCVLGRNGAGKSTLLKSIMGLVKTTAGTIKLENSEIGKLPAYQRARLGIGYVPQGRHIFPEMTVDENLKLGVINGPVDKALLDEIYASFPTLAERRTQLGGTLSGGEQEMLAIGRAMLPGPKLILMDEPSEGLSPLMVEKTAEAILMLRSRGLSVLLVEQQVGYALSISQRTSILEDGIIVHEASSEEVASNEMLLHRHLGTALTA